MLTTKPSKRVAAILAREDNGAVREEITPELKKDIYSNVIRMGLPSMASFLLMTVYELADTFWLAKIGPEPVAAVTIFGAFLWLLTFPNMVIGAGSVAVISRRFGEGDKLKTERAIKDTFLAKFIIGLLLGGVGLLITRWAVGLLGAEPEVRELAVIYGVVQCLVLGFALVSFSIYTALRGIGRPALGMWISAAGTVVNVALDPFLIFGWGPFPELGILGASIASACGFVTVVIAGCIALASHRSPVQVRWIHGAKPDVGEMIQMFRIGAPSGVNSLSFALMMNVRVKLFAIFGTNAVALYGMSQKVTRIGIMLIVGLGLGTGALIGQYLGSRQLLRAWLSAMASVQLAGLSMLVLAAVFNVFAPQIVSFFFKEPELYQTGIHYLRLMSIGLPLVGVIIQAENAYTGAGHNLPSMILGMSIDWLMIIPAMYISGIWLGFGEYGMLVGWLIAIVMGTLMLLYFMRRGTWLEHKI